MSAVSRQVVVLQPSWEFADEVIKRGSRIFPEDDLRTLYACIQCGTCVGDCPSGRRTAWRIRHIVRKTQLGMREAVLSDEALWNCTTCYTCQERCPRGVATTDIVRIIRNIAFEEGYALERHLAVARNFAKMGHAIPITDEVKKKREKLGLSPVPPTTLSYPKALAEVQKIIEIDSFLKKIQR